MSRHARLERLDPGERKKKRAPRIRLQALLRQCVREGALRLHQSRSRILPLRARARQQRRPMCARIQVRCASVKGLEARALCFHAPQSNGQRRFALLKRGCEGSGGLARTREAIRESAEARAFLLEGGLDLGDLRGEGLQRRDELGGLIPLGFERRRGRAGHLVELGDTPDEVLVVRLRISQRVLCAGARLVERGDLLARDLPVRGRRGGGMGGRAAHGAGCVFFEFAGERRGALRDPQVVAVRGRRVRELCGRRGLAQLVRRAEESRTQEIRLHGGIQALVDGAQRGRRLGQRVRVRPHEAQGLSCLLDPPGQLLALGLNRRDARRRLLAAGTQRLDACARLRQRAFDGESLFERAARARRLIAHLLRPLAESSHGLGRQRLRDDRGILSESGGQGRYLVACRLQAGRGLGDGRVEGRHGQGPPGRTRALPVGCDRLLRCGELGELCAHARVLRLCLCQRAALGKGTGRLACCRRGCLGEAHCLRVRRACALARAARPQSHSAGILRARVQLVGLRSGGRLGVGCVHAIGGILIKSRVQRPHALEGAERSRAPLLDAALRRGGRIG